VDQADGDRPPPAGFPSPGECEGRTLLLLGALCAVVVLLAPEVEGDGVAFVWFPAPRFAALTEVVGAAVVPLLAVPAEDGIVEAPPVALSPPAGASSFSRLDSRAIAADDEACARRSFSLCR
jgi:hypothetical protein